MITWQSPGPDIGYSTEEQFRRTSTLSPRTIRGKLECGRGFARFTAPDSVVDCPDVENVQLVRRPVPWKVYLFAYLLGLVCSFGLCQLLSLPSRPFFTTLAMLSAFLGHYGAMRRWIQIDYRDPSGEKRRAFFGPCSKRGEDEPVYIPFLFPKIREVILGSPAPTQQTPEPMT